MNLHESIIFRLSQTQHKIKTYESAKESSVFSENIVLRYHLAQIYTMVVYANNITLRYMK
jgi:hypothetical protein